MEDAEKKAIHLSAQLLTIAFKGKKMLVDGSANC